MTYLEKVMKALYLFFGICVLVGIVQLFIFWFGLGTLWTGDVVLGICIGLVATIVSLGLLWILLRVSETVMGMLIDED